LLKNTRDKIENSRIQVSNKLKRSKSKTECDSLKFQEPRSKIQIPNKLKKVKIKNRVRLCGNLEFKDLELIWHLDLEICDFNFNGFFNLLEFFVAFGRGFLQAIFQRSERGFIQEAIKERTRIYTG
jgi:hypothetical protein